MAKILIVDDEPRIRELIREHLQYAGYVCEEAGDGSAALSLLSGGGFDLVILDVMMPFMDGMTCLREMRARHINTPVIILTARGEEYDKLAGLEGGADDYVVKPFSPAELEARVSAHIRRESRARTGSKIRFSDDLIIDYSERSIAAGDNVIKLPRKEFDIVALLSQNRGQIFDRERIYERIWGYDSEGDSGVVTEHIRRIRNRMQEYTDTEYIETVWGCGYRWKK